MSLSRHYLFMWLLLLAIITTNKSAAQVSFRALQEEDFDCAVCLLSLKDGRELAPKDKFLCQFHSLHAECADLVMNSNTQKCPTCRAPTSEFLITNNKEIQQIKSVISEAEFKLLMMKKSKGVLLSNTLQGWLEFFNIPPSHEWYYNDLILDETNILGLQTNLLELYKERLELLSYVPKHQLLLGEIESTDDYYWESMARKLLIIISKSKNVEEQESIQLRKSANKKLIDAREMQPISRAREFRALNEVVDHLLVMYKEVTEELEAFNTLVFNDFLSAIGFSGIEQSAVQEELMTVSGYVLHTRIDNIVSIPHVISRQEFKKSV